MYCPVCGAESTQGLNYCKRCGSGLTAPAFPIEPSANTGKAMAGPLFLVALVAIAGFIALFSTVYNLGERQAFDPRVLIGIMAFGGGTVLGVIGLMVWLLLRLTPGYRSSRTPDTGRTVLRDYNAPQLAPPPSTMSSVTENTTRNFDPSAYRERGRRE